MRAPLGVVTRMAGAAALLGGAIAPGSASAQGAGPCVEAEALPRSGEVTVHRGLPSGDDAVVVLGPRERGELRFALPDSRPGRATLWVRVRAVTPANARLTAQLDGLDRGDAVRWDAPPTPVPRWRRVERGDGAPWPGRIGPTARALRLRARDPDVEIDALCLLGDDDVPEERFPPAPERPVTHASSAFGAVGDGVADDTAALQRALDALAPGDHLRLPAGRYRATRPLVLRTAEVTISGERRGAAQGTTLFFDHAAGSTADGLLVEGPGEGSSLGLLADAAFLSRAIAVPAAFGAAVGARVMLTSEGWGPPNADLLARGLPATHARYRAAYAGVVAVQRDGERRIVTLDRPLLSEFLRARGARVAPYRPLTGVVVRDLAFEGTTRHLEISPDPHGDWSEEARARNANTTLLRAVRCADCFFHRLELSHFRRQAIHLDRSQDCHVFDNLVRDATDWDGQSHGYGIGPTRSEGIVVRDNRFRGVMRHPLYLSWADRGCLLYRNDIVRPERAHPWMSVSVDIHGEDDYANLVEANVIVRGEVGVVVGGGGRSHGNDGPFNVVFDNEIRDAVHGVIVSDHSHDTVVARNRILGSREHAIWIRDGSARARVTGNVIDGWGRVGILSSDVEGLLVQDNRLRGEGVAMRTGDGSRDYDLRNNALLDDPPR